MHQSVLTWASRQVLLNKLNQGKILEVGSYNENGSVRTLFGNAEKYIGIDMRSGPGVDLVVNANDLTGFPDEEFDTVVCTEVLEHDSHFWLSLSEMGRVLKIGGHLLLTARGNKFPEHAYPSDFYRFMPGAGEILLRIAECFPLEVKKDPEAPGIFAVGRKVTRSRNVTSRSV